MLVDVERRPLVGILAVPQNLGALPRGRHPTGQGLRGVERAEPGCHGDVVVRSVSECFDGQLPALLISETSPDSTTATTCG